MQHLKTGDILLFYPASIMGRISLFFAGGKYSHAALVSVEDGTPFCIEVREWIGGRKIILAEYRKAEPAYIDVYRTNSLFTDQANPLKAVAHMKEFIGTKYGWWHVITAIIRRRFGIKLKHKECEKHPPFCSEAIARAFRKAGWDIVPYAWDRETLPRDLAESPCLDFIGELD